MFVFTKSSGRHQNFKNIIGSLLFEKLQLLPFFISWCFYRQAWFGRSCLRVMNWTCNFSCQLELGSDSHWTLDPNMAVDGLSTCAPVLSFPMRSSSPAYVLILSSVTTSSPPIFTGSPHKNIRCLDELVPWIFSPYLALFYCHADSLTALEPVILEPVPGEELVVWKLEAMDLFLWHISL